MENSKEKDNLLAEIEEILFFAEKFNNLQDVQ